MMGLGVDVNLKPVKEGAEILEPVLTRLAAALEEHNRIERTKHGLNTDPATGATSNAKSEEEHQAIVRDVQAALRQTEG